MRKNKAFTLIEVMVVMAIIAVLAILIIGAITLARHTATETTNRSNAKTVQTALEGNYAKYKAYCGAAPNAIACGANTLQAAATSLGVTIQASCTGVANYNGGGRITALSATGYTIEVWNWDCSANMAGDLLQV